MKRTRAQAFHSAEQHLAPGAEVVIVGPISRTWYADQGTLFELIELLYAHEIIPSVIGRSPFLHCALEAARYADKLIAFCDSNAPEAERMVEKVDLCIALPSRMSIDFGSAGPYVEVARERGVPVLAIWADGNATYFPAEAAS
jgi:hypothetical protein